MFAPTKIAVERRLEQQEELNQAYRAYLQDAFPLPGDEVYQLGFRLASLFRHPKVYCVDAWGRYYDPPLDLENLGVNRTTKELQQFLTDELDFDPYRDLLAYARLNGQESLVENWLADLSTLFREDDEAKVHRTLRETLLRGNQGSNIWDSHGPYLMGWFKVGRGHEYPGVDFVTAWYNRNLRIFANLQRITEGPSDRILLIIGSGHLPVLRHCALSSPEYELVEVNQYLE